MAILPLAALPAVASAHTGGCTFSFAADILHPLTGVDHLLTAAVLAVVAFFAVFRSFAHGQEVPAAGTIVAYVAGFTVATAVLHVAGTALARDRAAGRARRRRRGAGPRRRHRGGDRLTPASSEAER